MKLKFCLCAMDLCPRLKSSRSRRQVMGVIKQ